MLLVLYLDGTLYIYIYIYIILFTFRITKRDGLYDIIGYLKEEADRIDIQVIKWN